VPAPTAKPEHPLLASEVIRRSGMDPGPVEDDLWIDCPACHRHQSLADARVEPADDLQDITAYRCVNGCTVLTVTGHPNPVPMPGSGRYRLGDYAIAPLVPSGLLITLPTGRAVRLKS
jgi:hypothetical protein